MASTGGGQQVPIHIKDEYLNYIDDLFENYAIEVERACPLLCSEFGIDVTEAEAAVKFWTRKYGRRLRDS